MSNLKHPGYVPSPKTVPSPETPQNPVIRPGSRLATVGVFVEIIRRRFDRKFAGNDFPWPWNESPNVSKIRIESAFNEDTADKNMRPAIHVDADDMAIGRTVLGDLAGKQNTTGKTGFWNLETTPILIECEATKRAESAVIGDLVGVFLQASNRLIQAKFGFHDMTPLTIGRTQPHPIDKNVFVTAVTFSVQNSLRYTNEPTGPLLEHIDLAIRASGMASATEFFEKVAISATDDPDAAMSYTSFVK